MKKHPCWLLAGLLLVVGLCTGCSREAMEWISRNLVGICIQVSESEEEELFVSHSSKISPEEFDFGIERLSHGV